MKFQSQNSLYFGIFHQNMQTLLVINNWKKFVNQDYFVC